MREPNPQGPANPGLPGSRTTSADLDQFNTALQFLPGRLLSSHDFWMSSDGIMRVKLDIVLPDDSHRKLSGIRVEGWESDMQIPMAGSLFRVTWENRAMNNMNSILSADNRDFLRASYAMNEGQFKQILKGKMAAQIEPQTDHTKPPSFTSFVKELATGETCKYTAPDNLLDAMTRMQQNDGSVAVFGRTEPGQTYNSHSVVITPTGIYTYNSDKGEITAHFGKNTMIKKLTIENDTETVQGMAGLPSDKIPGYTSIPKGSIFTPHPERIPSFEIVEIVLNVVDSAKLIYDFIKAYSKISKGTR